MLNVDEDDIDRRCGHGPTEAGRRYLRQARVVEFSREGDTIRSAVKGSERIPYRQTIALTERRGGVEIAGRCSCPMKTNCKHVAAALFHAMTLAQAAKAEAARNPELRITRLLGTAVTRPDATPRVADPDLPSGVLAWLEDLARASEASGEDYPADINQRLVYLLLPVSDDPRMPQLGVQPVLARLRKDGTFAANSRPYPASSSTPGGPKYFRPSDSRIIRDLSRQPMIQALTTYRLTDEAGAEVLSHMLETGRARWLALDGPTLGAGPARQGNLSWREAGAGALLPQLTVDGAAKVLAATPPIYVDPAAGLVGPVDTGQPARVAAALFRSPPVVATTLAALNERLVRRAPALAGLTPPTPTTERRTGVKPVPSLRLFTALLPPEADDPAYRYHGTAYAEKEQVALARLSFRYGDVATPLGEARPTVILFAGGRLVELERDPAAEGDATRFLLSHGFEPAPDLRDRVPTEHARDFLPGDDPVDWLGALYDAVPELEAAGWDIAVASDFPFRMVRADGAYDAELREGSGVDWLELHLGVTVDGERVDLVEPLVALIASPAFSSDMFDGLNSGDDDEAVFLPLSDGRVLAMPLSRLRPIVEAMRELAFGLDRGTGSLRLSPQDAARIAEFEVATAGAALRWRGGDAIRDLGRKLTAAGGIPPVAVPPEFLATLRPYQAEGVAWLSLLREVGLGGILADDMGLGKTVQALAFLSVEKAAVRLDRPALVVAPTSLMGNWAREATRFAPGLRVLTLHGLARKALFESIPEHDLVLTTYPLVARDREVLAAQEWHVLLLDEAQTIKNPEAATTKLVLSLDARHRFCLTGTPIENNLAELWSLFSFACPGLLGDRKRFTANWRTPIEKGGDAERGRLLARRVRPFLLRRTKEEVARDLPPKTEMVERIDLEPAQRDIYETIRLSMHERIRKAIEDKGWAKSRIVVLDALLKLRQACCDPRLLKLKTKAAASAGSAKLERLEEMLRELLAEGRRVIVFSQFTSMLDLMRPRLDAAGIRYVLLTGTTRDRPAAIAEFDSGKAQVFLISLKAGGVGLNLVSADTVVLYDPWWNPAVEKQAIDRAHRIGQTKPVFVHKLVAAGTIEEKMEVLKEKKAALAASLFDPDGEPTLAMTEADIEMLLAS